MDEAIARLFRSLCDSPDWGGADLSDINACAIDGDNALHVAVRRPDLAAARALIDAGIDINKAGDLGYTPLHVACMKGDVEMVKLLISKGADLFALSEGDSPFTCARLGGQDHICKMLEPMMDEGQSRDPQIWIRARIGQLKRELARLEAKLDKTVARAVPQPARGPPPVPPEPQS